MVKLDLPEPETPVMQVKVPSGIDGGDVLQIVGRGAVDGELLAGALAALGRELDLARAVEIIGGERVLRLEDLLERALGDDLAAMDAGAGAHVDDIVGGADRVLVMLDDEDGVAEIAQPLERVEQPVIVALVQADGGLVEDVEHARQAASRSGWRGGCAGSRRRTACPLVRSRLR